MNTDGKIYITISETPVGNGGGTTPTPQPTPPAPSPKPQETSEEKALKWEQQQLFDFAKGQVKQMVNYTLGNIGNFTGDFYTQRSINDHLQVGSTLLNIGNSAINGLKMGGVQGMGIGLLVATSSVAVNMVLGDISKAVENKKRNRDIEMIRNLSGLNVLTNGSR